MGRFFAWLLPSALIAALAYAALVALSLTTLPWTPAPFDAQLPTTSQPGWVNEARYFMLNKHGFATPENRIVILGASTSRDPFRPDRMQQAMPGWAVANASLSGAAISEIADEVGLYYREKPKSSGGTTVFVLAVTYLQFHPITYPDGVENPLATEALRGGLYARQNGVLTPRYGRTGEQAILALFRPQAIAASLPRRAFKAVFANPRLPAIKNAVDRLRGDDPVARWTEVIGEHPDLNAISVPPAMQRALMAQRLAATKGDRALPDDEFRVLDRLIKTIRARGDRVVLVDLPLPRWHRTGARTADASYILKAADVIEAQNDPANVEMLSLREFDADENFFDSGHTKPRLWPVMSDRLVEGLDRMGLTRPPGT